MLIISATNTHTHTYKCVCFRFLFIISVDLIKAIFIHFQSLSCRRRNVLMFQSWYIISENFLFTTVKIATERIFYCEPNFEPNIQKFDRLQNTIY